MNNQPPKIIARGADITADGMHRYSLYRTWDIENPGIVFIGLNPSTATAETNDATITRCERFAYRWGYGRMFFLNLYSFRTPAVHESDLIPTQKEQGWKPLLDNLHIAVGPDYDKTFAPIILNAKTVVCCWGAFEFAKERARYVLQMIKEVKQPMCMGINANGSPKHPLYLATNTQLVPYLPLNEVERVGVRRVRQKMCVKSNS